MLRPKEKGKYETIENKKLTVNMKKLISIVIALAVCDGALAQPKSTKGCSAPIYSRDFAKMEILDTTELRVRYAFCAEKIDDPLT